MIFLTGCDKNTEWQLPWFIHNFRAHSEATIHVADFGMTEEMSAFAHANFDAVHVLPEFEAAGGWFNKIAAMMHMANYGEQPYCWLDTDCQVMRKPDSISRFIEPNKLTMVIDHPWSTRRPEMGVWYNSGVVGFYGKANILGHWRNHCQKNNFRGDQEGLHDLLGGDLMRKAALIADAPHRYNTLRLDIIDNNVPDNPVIMHWTGAKGNDEIREQMKSL